MLKTIKRRPYLPQQTEALCQFHPVLQRVFAARQVTSAADLDYRLNNLNNPAGMKGLQPAVELLTKAIQSNARILIVGDFDADGATSSALAVTALKSFGAVDVDYLVPNRFEFGYGLTPEIVEVAARSQPKLIVTVDNGISSIEGVALANNLGIDVLITDHHLPGKALPGAAVIVNPNQPGCGFNGKNLAGVGVIYYVMIALRSHLRALGWFENNNIPEPNMAALLDLVALGTVADLVALDTNNRLLVQQGLNRIRALQARPGINAILAVAGRQPDNLIAADLGFVLGPRLNAAGRLDDMSLGIRCLLSTDITEAMELAQSLNDLNQDRRAIEASMQKEALSALAALDFDPGAAAPWGLCLSQPQWHQGVVGIVASRIKERFHRPVIAFANSDNGAEIKGSARSITGLHIRDTLDRVATREPKLIKKFGGHAMAAGLTIDRSNLAAFSQAFDQAVRAQISSDELDEVILSDGELTADEFTLALATAIRAAGPWGQAFPEPLFDGEFNLLQQRIVGHRHLKLVVSPISQPQLALDAIAFNIDVAQWPTTEATLARLVYQLEVNEYRGRQSVQLMVRHIWPL